jgi:3-oxoacyl-[acyl-carrier-protein] synthase I
MGYRLASLGMVNCLGNSLGEIWNRLCSRDYVTHIQRGDLIPNRSILVGEVVSPLPTLPPELASFDCRVNRLLAATYEQIAPSVQQILSTVSSERLGVVLGSSTGGVAETEEALQERERSGEIPESFHFFKHELGTMSNFLARLSGARGPAYTVSTACSSSAKAFSSARGLLDLDLCDAVIVGGCDTLCRLTLNGFASLSLLSRGYSRPMSEHRDGITIGEGAALFLLVRDGGGVQLLGIGESSDAYHMSAPHAEGRGAAEAMSMALTDAGCRPAEISYVNLHGTGSTHNDIAEARAMVAVFGETLPLSSSTKPLTGHTLGAAGAMEAGICWLALEYECAPPHAWDGVWDPSIPRLPLVESPAPLERASLRVLSNSLAFGGSNCSLLLGRDA